MSENVQKITAPTMRRLIREGGHLEMETVLLNGEKAWRVQVRMPDDPAIYRVIVYQTSGTKYFQSLITAYNYFCAEVPDAETFTVNTKPVEEITAE